MNDNSEREIGISYSLFATGDGEVFSGGGGMPRDEFVDFLAEQFAIHMKILTDENPNRIISFVMDTEAVGESREGWMYHTEKHHPLAPIMVPLGRFFNRISHWLWEKSSTGEWKKITRPVPPWNKEAED